MSERSASRSRRRFSWRREEEGGGGSEKKERRCSSEPRDSRLGRQRQWRRPDQRELYSVVHSIRITQLVKLSRQRSRSARSITVLSFYRLHRWLVGRWLNSLPPSLSRRGARVSLLPKFSDTTTADNPGTRGIGHRALALPAFRLLHARNDVISGPRVTPPSPSPFFSISHASRCTSTLFQLCSRFGHFSLSLFLRGSPNRRSLIYRPTLRNGR